MANPMRILFVSDEVAPFTKTSVTAELVRTLPEQLQESGDYEVRLMMPRYGTISERRNRLHEVIRLSGTEIDMGTQTETLKVKVASIPGIRLQVYFMDNNSYFKRKGVYSDKQGNAFPDNPERALFFGRAALETIRNLRWRPDVVHAFGWMAGFVPMLLRTEYATEPLYEQVKSIFTPNDVGFQMPLTERHVKTLSLPEDVLDRAPNAVGAAYADGVIYPATVTPTNGTQNRFSSNREEMIKEALALYEQVLNEVPA